MVFRILDYDWIFMSPIGSIDEGLAVDSLNSLLITIYASRVVFIVDIVVVSIVVVRHAVYIYPDKEGWEKAVCFDIVI